jgi:hypothetical protein
MAKPPFWATAFLRRFCQIWLDSEHPSFHFFGFRQHCKDASLASKPHVSVLSDMVAQLYPPPGTGFPFRCLLRFAGLRWRYSNQPPPGKIPMYTVGNSLRLIFWRFHFIVFLNTFKRITRQYPERGHNHFLPHLCKP